MTFDMLLRPGFFYQQRALLLPVDGGRRVPLGTGALPFSHASARFIVVQSLRVYCT